MIDQGFKQNANGSDISYTALDGNFGWRVTNIDFRNLSDSELIRLLYELYHNRFLVLHPRSIDKATYLNFAKRLGEPISMSRDEHFPEIGYITNQNVDTRKTMTGATHWHTDQSFRSAVSNITMLYSVQTPATGGETKFCDMAAAYAALPQQVKEEIDGLVVGHRHGVSVVAPQRRPFTDTVDRLGSANYRAPSFGSHSSGITIEDSLRDSGNQSRDNWNAPGRS